MTNPQGTPAWYERLTADPAASRAFDDDVIGWTHPEKMEMPGDMGDYMFVDVGDRTIGATRRAPADGPPANWQFYFRAPDIEAAAEKVKAGGGAIHAGPMDVPGGDRIIVASDPHGLMFGVVGPGNGGDPT